MTETETLAPIPQPAPILAPVAPPPPPAARPRRNFWPLLGLLGFLILAAGEAYLYRLHAMIPDHAPQIAVLQAQVADLQAAAARAAPAPDAVAVQADLGEKYATLAAQVAAMQTQGAADHGTLTQLAANSSGLTKLTAKVELLNRLETARMALDAGQPLGAIAGAPPALAQYAAAAPPTEAALLLGYPAAARAADDASVARAQQGSIWGGALGRLENLVTISNGSHVILGAPAAAITAQAQALLQAGDLAGAVDALAALSQPTQNAMNPWLQNARNLLAARAALISMAGG